MTVSLPNNTYIVRIKAVDGLLFLTYNSGIPADANEGFITSKGVTHVLSISNNTADNRPRPNSYNVEGVKVKQIRIHNSPSPDVLSSLNEASKWIEKALAPASEQRDPNQVLIRAEGGCEIRVANGVLVGFLMRYLKATYSTGLRLAQDSIPSLQIDTNLERQLRIWEFCRYNIYQIDPQSRVTSPRPSLYEGSMPGMWPLTPFATRSASPAPLEDNYSASNSSGLHKPAYVAWRKECDTLEAIERAKALSNLVRAADGTASDDLREAGPQGCAKDLLSQMNREAKWARVEEMEKTWNDRLVNGTVLA